ncbi:MAG TPA: chromosomal replication initiator protein DnaA [Thermoleophilaceae bacterium]|nr:chromosomal replication initiator protein DnaA [Thermoleophilaceae bacterium]
MSAEPDQTWDAVRAELQRRAPEFKYRTWLEPLELAGHRGGTFYVRAPEHIRSWVGERYLPLVRDAAVAVVGPGASVEIVGEGWSPPEDAEAPGPRAGQQRLNPKYTFEQFVIGEGSRLAHAAALAVAEMPGQAYNPLLIHGRPGLGKTHLLHAIGNYVQRYGSGLSVRYATVEEFTTDFVEAVRDRRTRDFKDRFRGTDVVLIDDVQFLARKERTREEFFHTFNALQDSGRQLVLTSDRDPDELVDLEDRLSERFRSGLVVELEPPEPEVRRVILQKRAGLDGVGVAPEVLDEIAEQVTSSVRALEGSLIQVVAHASVRGEAPSPESVRRLLGGAAASRAPRQVGFEDVMSAAAAELGVSSRDLRARSRRPPVVWARHLAMYLARELTGASLPDIGRAFGGRNHTTVLHAVRHVEREIERDQGTRSAVGNLLTRLGGSRS